MKKSDISRLRELVDLCEGHECYEASLLPPRWRVPTSHPIEMALKWPQQHEIRYDELQWGLETQLDNGREVFWNENPWVVGDWPNLSWTGNCFFHRTCPEIATITGVTTKQLDQALERYRRLQQSRESLSFPGIMELLPLTLTSLIYLVEGTTRGFSGSIYRPRLRAFKKMVQWAMPKTEVGFTVVHTVSDYWGYMLVSPWLIKSTDPVWLQRLKMFQSLNSYDPTRWPMSLLIENWSAFREIRF